MTPIDIPIDSILIPPRKRGINPDKANGLANSMAQSGLINPITLKDDGMLLAGLHRIEAAKILNWETIPAITISNLDALQAELIEIDENLIRDELTPLEQGEWMNRRNEVLLELGQRKPSHRPNKGLESRPLLSTFDIASEMGMAKSTAQQRMQIARTILPEVKEVIYGTELEERATDLLNIARLAPDLQMEVTQRIINGNAKNVSQAKQEIARQRTPEPAITPPLPDRKYRCIILDPPWPIKKIEREERPNQGIELDYPTMTIEKIESLPVKELADSEGCHLYLWVTQKFLPTGLNLVELWGFRYQCLMTWRKNVGFTPYSWMYDTEHIIFATMGNLKLSQLGLRLSFDAPVNGHSVKPDIFFNERVILASPEPRLEMFARKQREGFEVWGNEVLGK